MSCKKARLLFEYEGDRISIKNNKLNGSYKNRKYHRYYINGKQNGKDYVYDLRHNIMIIRHHINNVMNGYYFMMHENGEIESIDYIYNGSFATSYMLVKNS